MGWRLKGVFASPEVAVRHMVELLAIRAEFDGTPLTGHDKDLLLQDRSKKIPLPDDLRQRAVNLIGKIFEAEDVRTADDPGVSAMPCSGPMAQDTLTSSFLAEQVACDIAHVSNPPQGWPLVRDRVQLIGCGILVVLTMFGIVIAVGFIFHWK